MSLDTFEKKLYAKIDALLNKFGVQKSTNACSEGLQKAISELNSYEIALGDPELIHAAGTGDLQRVFALLYCECEDPNAKSASGATALIQATLDGHENLGVIELLLDRGVDVNAATSDGLTALMVAVIKGYESVVDLLLKAGADIYARDMFGYNAVTLAQWLSHSTISTMLTQASKQRSMHGEFNAKVAVYQAAL